MYVDRGTIRQRGSYGNPEVESAIEKSQPSGSRTRDSLPSELPKVSELEESKCGGSAASEQRKGEVNSRLRRMTIADIPLRACREFPSFKLPMEPDWRGHIGSLCWPRVKVLTACPVGIGQISPAVRRRESRPREDMEHSVDTPRFLKAEIWNSRSGSRCQQWLFVMKLEKGAES